MLKRVCKKHATWIGCAAAVVTFVALHVAVPAGVATWIAHPAHGGSIEQHLDVVLKTDDVIVYSIEVESTGWIGTRTCLVAVAPGRMADTVDVECVR